jgi:diguanylate cyclase (GGDEF)-like protein/PAS domain S-box-containing protein
MSQFSPFWLKAKSSANVSLDAMLFAFSVYGVPAAIAVVSLIALFSWDSPYSTETPAPLEFRVLEQTGSSLEPRAALAALAAKPLVQYQDTNRSEAPFWLSFSTRAAPDGEHADIEFPSRHAATTRCWNATDFAPVGEADRVKTSGWFERAKAGIAISLRQPEKARALLCRVTSVGPARISVLQWPAAEFDSSVQRFQRDSGLLNGGLILLSVFVLVTAIVNREWTYVVFAAWLISNLRLAALSAGWDTQWLEHSVPESWLLSMRQLTCATFYILTIALFSRVFREDLKKVGYGALLRADQWTCLPMLIVSTVLPYAAWLPWLWALSAFTLTVLLFLLIRIILITRSSVALWFGASMGVTLFASYYEVVAAALNLKGLIGSINFVTASLSSGLLAALAIAEQMRQERHERMRAQAELHSTYEAIPIGLFTLDHNGIFKRGNPALNEMVGVDPEKRGGRHWSEIFEPGAWQKLQEMVRHGEHEIELKGIPPAEGEPNLYLVQATLANDKIEGSLQDITERHKATATLRFLAEHDPLTGVLNRRGVEKAYDEAMRNMTEGRSLALAYLDLDRFKLINDLYGHVAGDEVLKQVCVRIKESLGAGQELGRIGGDEFVILIKDTDFSAAQLVCRNIVDKIVNLPYRTSDKAFQVKGSIGLVEISAGTWVKDAISAADRACREAKKGLHNDLVAYEKGSPIFRERQEELRLVEHLGAGNAPEGLFLVMQPIMSVTAPYDSLNFEILLRLREKDESISPAWKIISAAENNGRSGVIDRWVMSNALEWLDTHQDKLGNTRFACMNLSGGSLNDERFIADAYAMLAQHRRAAQMLCIEITESVALHDLDNTRRFIDKVKGFGAKIALDDFGAGYTSFSYLKELRADTLKIDGNFVVGINGHPANISIVEAIVQLARNLGMKSVAEWAEDQDTVETLVEVGVDYIQGFAIARPQLPEAILAAQSSAGFISNEKMMAYVRDSLATGKVIELWNGIRGSGPKGAL